MNELSTSADVHKLQCMLNNNLLCRLSEKYLSLLFQFVYARTGGRTSFTKYLDSLPNNDVIKALDHGLR